jgi:hypothetical protein
MKLLTEYLERARSFERLAAEENNREIRAQFKKLATTYRELAAERAGRYGLSAPSTATASGVSNGGPSDRDRKRANSESVIGECRATDRQTPNSGSIFCPIFESCDMPKSHITPTMFALSPIEQPRCAWCQVRMALTGISLGPQGRDFRTFECAKCDQTKTVIADDPMKSEKTGRLQGELKPPQ